MAHSIHAEPYTMDPTLQVDLVTTGLSSPTSMAFVGPNDILVLEKNTGDVKLVTKGQLMKKPVLHLDVDSTTFTCCRGLLGIATSGKNLAANEEVYIYFTASRNDESNSSIVNKVNKYLWDGTKLAHPSTILELPAIPGPNHPGGKLVLDGNGTLYTIIGDLNNEGLLQNIKDKKEITDSSVIIRINSADGSAIVNNPFINLKKNYPQSQMEKYYGYGVRNSFGLAIDPMSGYLWDTENGDKDYDEINLIYPGFNSGWKKLMGPIAQSDVREDQLVNMNGSKYFDPVFSWNPSLGVTGIEFFKSQNFGSSYTNNIFVGDINNGNIYYLKLNETRNGLVFYNPDIESDLVADSSEKESLIWGGGFKGITDLKTGPDGNLYVLTFDESKEGDGGIYRISAK
ncbi:MAG TPA: PQQ-dependent sugar dehydrogenase [Candidatus Nitrosocosmicus sp.]|nr:PQQ-dependent sugar dehydrogenase [Candidatus Nitrosocosmicus sp.]